MSPTTAPGIKQLIEAVADAEGDPLAAREALLSLRSELEDLDHIGDQLARTEEGMLQVRMAFDEAPLGMAVLDADGSFLKVNRALCRMLGYSSEELADTTLDALTHSGDRLLDRSKAAQIWDGQCGSYTIQKRYLHKNGGTILARLTASVLHDEMGSPLYRLALIDQISPVSTTPVSGGSLDLPRARAHCRNCRSDLLVRSRWRLWEWPLLLLLLQPVRCRSCARRAFKFLWAGVPGRVESQD